MLRAKKTETRKSATGLRFGIAAARYNSDLADTLAEHCVNTLMAAGARQRDIKVMRVPGSFEISAAAARLAKSGKFDCVIGLGVILKGETMHAQNIAEAVAHGLTWIAIDAGVPTVFGVVTANNLHQARVRCLGQKHNRGCEAAQAAIEMAALWKNR